MVKERGMGRIYVTIPHPHHGQDFSVGLLAQILKEGEISRDEWLSV
jgi:predicted RNA binding protein YcfA (HicA-like mRNA interferase family)